MCERNYSPPQRFDIKTLLSTESPAVPQEKVKQQTRMPITLRGPLGDTHLKSMLSINKNKCLQEKWQSFLDNRPDKIVHLELYRDHVERLKQTPSWRMKLTGHFYDVNNKLAPVSCEKWPSVRS